MAARRARMGCRPQPPRRAFDRKRPPRHRCREFVVGVDDDEGVRALDKPRQFAPRQERGLAAGRIGGRKRLQGKEIAPDWNQNRSCTADRVGTELEGAQREDFALKRKRESPYRGDRSAHRGEPPGACEDSECLERAEPEARGFKRIAHETGELLDRSSLRTPLDHPRRIVA